MEYGCHIWDGCSNQNSDSLEALQLEMARIVTGARKGTSHELLYKELNWQTLASRRDNIKRKQFIRIINGETPKYLQNILPNRVGTVRPVSRKADDFTSIKTRTCTFEKSFIPSAIKLFNETGPENRSMEFIVTSMKTKCNELFYLGSRRENIFHAQLRMQCSKLNAHLFNLHVVDSPSCLCGHNFEDS